MSNHRDALWEIAEMCKLSRTQTRRIQSIHETAMVALGMTESQRNERHQHAFKVAENHRLRRQAEVMANKERKAA